MALSVPVCGLGHSDGADFFAFDEHGEQLPLLPLGESVDNNAIALAAPRAASKTVVVYFGSKARAPIHRQAFLPSVLLDVRTLPDGPNDKWTHVERLIGKSERLGRTFVDNIELSYNPVDSTDACILIFEGYLKVPKAGKQTFMLVSDDAGYLFINGELLLARDGRNWARDAVRGEFRKEIELTAGFHAIQCVIVEMGGELMGVVGRWIDGHNKHALKPGDFLQPGKTRLITVEARNEKLPNPAFWCKRLSYMSYQDVHYTEVAFGTYSKQPARWGFGDGGGAEGAEVSRIFVGLESRSVKAAVGRVEASGLITFPENPPPQRQMGNTAHFTHYAGLMLKQDLDKLDTATLFECIHFLDYNELNEDVIPFCEALLKRSRLDRDQAREALLSLARAAARNFPKKATLAYRRLLSMKQAPPPWKAVAREYAEYAIFRLRDYDLAASTIETMKESIQDDDRTLMALELDLALQKGDLEAAKRKLDQYLGGSEFGEKHRYAVVKGNALRQRFSDLLQAGFILQARDVLHQWSGIAPFDRTNGSFSLARSQLFQTLGWLDGALGELDGAILMNPLLPNLPDVELEQARIHQKAGDDKVANATLMKIIKEYPNHPAADLAKEMLK